MFKATLFACVIAAAGLGCRNADRNPRETSYSNPVESSTYNTGTEAPPGDMQARPGDVTTRRQGTSMGFGTRHHGASAVPGTSPELGTSAEPGTSAEIDDEADTSSIPSAGGTDQVQSGNVNAPADSSTGAAATPESNEMSGTGAGANADTNPSTDTSQPSSGLNETATGIGTTTNTGVNTENAGSGGTDDPQR